MTEGEILFYAGLKRFHEKTQSSSLYHTRKASIGCVDPVVLYPELAFSSATNVLFTDSMSELVTAFGLVTRIYVN